MAMTARLLYLAVGFVLVGWALAILGIALIYPPGAVIAAGGSFIALGVAVARGSGGRLPWVS